MKFKYDVFLSFSGEDIDFVKPVWEKLKKSGLIVFFSNETLKEYIGQAFDDKLEDALEKSKHFLLICTPNSMKSKWVKIECKTFFNEFYTESDKTRRFIILEGKEFESSLLPSIYRILQRSKSVSEIIGILKDEEVQSNDQKMMTPKKKVDRTANERKDTLWQRMESHMVQIPAGMVLLKDKNWGNQTFITEVSPFLMDKYPVTQDLYEEIMGKEKNKSKFKGGDKPVETVTWFEAVEFCNRLSDKTGLKPVYTIVGEKVTADWGAEGYRLPTEAEWRYACRAGTTGERYGKINQIAWYKGNSNESTQGVGNKESNQWGLCDMLGNVWEWCWDLWGIYSKVDKKDWRGPESWSQPYRKDRIATGGAWNSTAEKCTYIYRKNVEPGFSANHLGFRLAKRRGQVIY